MRDAIYEWLQNLAVYLILVSAVWQVLPKEEYQKYVRFFAGLVLMILLLQPVLKLTDMELDFEGWMEEETRELEQSISDLQIPEESGSEVSGWESEPPIEVGEIQIGE